jgi:hypothetical protein
MAGPESEPCIDLDGDPVRGEAAAVMRPMHHEAAGLHRRKPFEAPAHPVCGSERLETQVLREVARALFACRLPGDRGDQRAHHAFVRSIAEMERQRPAPVRRVLRFSFRFLRNRDGDALAEMLGEGILDMRSRGFIDREPCNDSGVGMRARHDRVFLFMSQV